MNAEKQKSSKKMRKGDTVVAISGNYRGLSGTVLSCKGDKVVVQGLNVRKKHVKGQGDQKGQILQIEKPLNISNLQVCDKNGKPIKLHTRTNAAGDRELYYNDGSKSVVYRSLKKLSN